MNSDLEINADLACHILGRFIREEVLKVGAKGVVVALSGGIDSALALVLAVQGLGADSALAVCMPYRHSHSSSLADAKLVADKVGVALLVEDISGQIDAYFGSRPTEDLIRRGNKLARERMSIAYDISQERSALVLGTSNKSEMLLGYGTIFGDMAYAINPLGDLYKTQVYQLARHLRLPEAVITKPPSADLFAGQLDEVDLGFSYREADQVLFYLVDQRRQEEEVIGLGYSPDLVRAVMDRMRRSQLKRRPPLIAKLSARTIETDFRYPRDWGY